MYGTLTFSCLVVLGLIIAGCSAPAASDGLERPAPALQVTVNEARLSGPDGQPAAISNQGATSPPPSQGVPGYSKPDLKYPALGSALDHAVQKSESEGTFDANSEDSTSGSKPPRVETVSIYLSGNVPEVLEFLQDNDVEPVDWGPDYIVGHVPVPLLGELSEQPGVLRVRVVALPVPSWNQER